MFTIQNGLVAFRRTGKQALISALRGTPAIID
jgi:hypothetical protein